MNKTALILLTISVALAIALSLVYMQNMQLKEQVNEQINEQNKEYETGVMEGVNDFTLFVINKVKACQAVTLMANKESATVIDAACK